MTGKTHQIFNDLAIMRTLPNMVVVAPADQEEARQAIQAIANWDGPVYMQITRENSPVLFGTDHRFKLGEAVVLRDGTDATLVSTGVQTTRVFEAAEIPSGRGIEVGVVHLPTVKPLDENAIVAAARLLGSPDRCRRTKHPRWSRRGRGRGTVGALPGEAYKAWDQRLLR